jgi:hypothetical protein
MNPASTLKKLSRDDLISVIDKSSFAIPMKALVKAMLYQMTQEQIDGIANTCNEIAQALIADDTELARSIMEESSIPKEIIDLVISKTESLRDEKNKKR